MEKWESDSGGPSSSNWTGNGKVGVKGKMGHDQIKIMNEKFESRDQILCYNNMMNRIEMKLNPEF